MARDDARVAGQHRRLHVGPKGLEVSPEVTSKSEAPLEEGHDAFDGFHSLNETRFSDASASMICSPNELGEHGAELIAQTEHARQHLGARFATQDRNLNRSHSLD